MCHPEKKKPGPLPCATHEKKSYPYLLNFNVLWRLKETATKLRWTSNFWNIYVTILWFRDRYGGTLYRIPETKLNEISCLLFRAERGFSSRSSGIWTAQQYRSVGEKKYTTHPPTTQQKIHALVLCFPQIFEPT